MGDGDAAFHAWLKTQFSDLDSAKEFVWVWMNERDQELPEWGEFTMRAMAAHVSMALEGKEYGGPDSFCTSYLDTKHGSELYFAMCRQRPTSSP